MSHGKLEAAHAAERLWSAPNCGRTASGFGSSEAEIFKPSVLHGLAASRADDDAFTSSESQRMVRLPSLQTLVCLAQQLVC